MLAALVVGSAAQWLTFFAFAVAAYFVWKGGGGTALGILQEANRILEGRVHDLERQTKIDAAKIAELQASRDFTLALRPIVETLTTHEERAQARFERTLTVQQLIADRLGPDKPTGAE